VVPRHPSTGYKGDAGKLELYAAMGHRFWCHDGLLRVVQWRHEPSGVTIPAHPATYTPPVRDGVPYKADGSAGYLCAGWDARRRANAALAVTLETGGRPVTYDCTVCGHTSTSGVDHITCTTDWTRKVSNIQ
jgi:hypothetical protein